MKEERKLILKLGQMITDRVGVKVTVEDPEYWGLAEVLTDEMAEVCLSMKVRKPMTLEQIARKSGKDPERVQKLLDEMSVIGMIEYTCRKGNSCKAGIRKCGAYLPLAEKISGQICSRRLFLPPSATRARRRLRRNRRRSVHRCR